MGRGKLSKPKSQLGSKRFTLRSSAKFKASGNDQKQGMLVW